MMSPCQRSGSRVGLVFLAISFTGCATISSTPAADDWVAIIDNGDKPAIGVRMTSQDDRVRTVAMSLLDPDTLDFETGLAFEVSKCQFEGKVVTFTAPSAPGTTDQETYKIYIADHLSERSLRAVLLFSDHQSLELVFNRE